MNLAPKALRKNSVETSTLASATEHRAHQSCFLERRDHLVNTSPCIYCDGVMITVGALLHEQEPQHVFQDYRIAMP